MSTVKKVQIFLNDTPAAAYSTGFESTMCGATFSHKGALLHKWEKASLFQHLSNTQAIQSTFTQSNEIHENTRTPENEKSSNLDIWHCKHMHNLSWFQDDIYLWERKRGARTFKTFKLVTILIEPSSSFGKIYSKLFHCWYHCKNGKSYLKQIALYLHVTDTVKSKMNNNCILLVI